VRYLANVAPGGLAAAREAVLLAGQRESDHAKFGSKPVPVKWDRGAGPTR
jgi:hypothetical protein